MKSMRIGSGAGYAGDRLEPALTLLDQGNLDYICFECLAERTIALAQKEKKNDPKKGYNHLLEYRMEEILPLAFARKTKVITNMGAANPLQAMQVTREIAKRKGITGLKIAAVLGDDVLDLVKRSQDLKILETGQYLSILDNRIISANAYLGSAGIIEALKQGADVVITGRTADPSLFLAPMIHEFGWSMEDFEKLGRGTMVGHLLECAGQVCGGYFADTDRKTVPDLWNIGFPFVEIDENGEGIISKVEGTGGIINTATCTEQLLYEIHDPAHYLTPDCTADFSAVEFESEGKDLVRFRKASGKKASDFYKVSIGFINGFLGEGQISYGGTDCIARAQLAAEIVKKRLEKLALEDVRFERIGLNSITPYHSHPQDLLEVRLRVCAKADTLEKARKIGQEVETLYTNGPYGGGGVTQNTEEVISVVSVLIPKDKVKTHVEYTVS
ncbi:acyclic terpene utilization AtuA family protein [Cecembia calidifontis]|uniref:Uncharacterized protein DUF1446 n=1 Tax=Cecembia calidifontis TaxID=1187080 RepID=A0A4Q7PA38_9BACT|nr:acyclic terpene utilization AtuA family protein [Cecembia calidifontis]RZS97051.1 uncharacterized protein DUF1446 [Cecembia calidifontis]